VEARVSTQTPVGFAILINGITCGAGIYAAPLAICSDGFAFRLWLTTGIHVLVG
jgi:amino acid permease